MPEGLHPANPYRHHPGVSRSRMGYSSYSDDSSMASSSSLSTTAWSTDSSMADEDYMSDENDDRFPPPLPVGAYDNQKRRKPEMWESAELSSVDYSTSFRVTETLTSTPCASLVGKPGRPDADGCSFKTRSEHGYGSNIYADKYSENIYSKPTGPYQQKQVRCQGQCCGQGHQVYSQGHQVYSQGHQVYTQGHPVYSQGHQVYSQGHQIYSQGHQGHRGGVVQDPVYGRHGDVYGARKLEAERRSQPEGRSVYDRRTGMSSMTAVVGSDVSHLTASPPDTRQRLILHSRPLPERPQPSRHFPRHSTPQRLPRALQTDVRQLPRRATPPGACDDSATCHDVTASSIQSDSAYSSFPDAPANSYVSGGTRSTQQDEDDADVTLEESEMTLDQSEMSSLDEEDYEKLKTLEEVVELREASRGQEVRIASHYEVIAEPRHAPVVSSHDITAFSVAASDATDFMERPMTRKPVTHRAPAQHQRRKVIARCLKRMGRRLKLTGKQAPESPLRTLALL